MWIKLSFRQLLQRFVHLVRVFNINELVLDWLFVFVKKFFLRAFCANLLRAALTFMLEVFIYHDVDLRFLTNIQILIDSPAVFSISQDLTKLVVLDGFD